jgi:hypothetical protein
LHATGELNSEATHPNIFTVQSPFEFEMPLKKLWVSDSAGRRWALMVLTPEPGTEGPITVTLEDGRPVKRVSRDEFEVVGTGIRLWLGGESEPLG